MKKKKITYLFSKENNITCMKICPTTVLFFAWVVFVVMTITSSARVHGAAVGSLFLSFIYMYYYELTFYFINSMTVLLWSLLLSFLCKVDTFGFSVAVAVCRQCNNENTIQYNIITWVLLIYFHLDRFNHTAAKHKLPLCTLLPPWEERHVAFCDCWSMCYNFEFLYNLSAVLNFYTHL